MNPESNTPTASSVTVEPGRGQGGSAASWRAQVRWLRLLWLLAPLLIVQGPAFWGARAADVSDIEVQGTVTEVRSLLTGEWGVPYPTGVAYLPSYDHLVLLTNVDASGPLTDSTAIVTITPHEDFIDAASLPFAVDNTINIAYDDAADHLLLLDQVASDIVLIPVNGSGIPDVAALSRVDIAHLGLGQPAGMAVDTTARHLLILDSSISAVVVVDLDNEFTLVSQLDLSHLSAADLRGLALHPIMGTLFVTSPSQALLLEVSTSGSSLNAYSLAPLAPMTAQGMSFGFSTDLTDPPDTTHLFLADSGVPGTIPLLGRVVEAALSLDDGSGDETVRFAVIGDYGRDDDAEARVAALVQTWNPDFIVTTGDNNYPDGEAATIDKNIGKYFSQYIGNYQGAYGPGSPTNRFWPSLGNHDWHSITCEADSCNGPYFDYFTLPHNERYYAVDLGLVHLFILDSERDEPHGRDLDSIQAAWLREQLAASDACYNLLFFHRAPYGSGRHGSHATMQWPFASWGAQAIFSGHDHLYERLEVDGIPYFVNGAGGATLYEFENIGNLPPEAASIVRYNQDHGAMLVTASSTAISYQFYAVDGSLIDGYMVFKECADVAAPTPTPTFTPSPTPTSTATPTLTPTSVAVPTPAPTRIPLILATPSTSRASIDANDPFRLHLPLITR